LQARVERDTLDGMRIAAFALLMLAAGCRHERAPAPLVVWIEVDTLRADALGCYGNRSRGEGDARPSPALDALAADGVLFEHATSAAPWTIPSLATQLSGLWPWEHGCRRLLELCSTDATSFVPLLAARGVRTAGVMTNFVATGRYGFARGFELWDDGLSRGHEGSSAPEAVERLLAFADLTASDPRAGRLLFGWFFEPHYRYEEHPGLRFGPGYGDQAAEPYTGPLHGDEDLNPLLARRAELGPADAAFLRGRYQGEVAAVDRAIGTLVAGLRERGLYDDAWIVFTADHGEEVLDRGSIGHASTLHEELVRIPLIVKPPRALASDRRGVRVADRVSLIDLPATLYEIATGREPDRARGELGHSESLLATILRGAKPARRWLYLHTDFEPVLQDASAQEKRAHQWGVVDAETGLKWIVDRKVEPGAPPRVALYDLGRDPLEHDDLAASDEGAKRAAPMQRLRALEPAATGEEPLAPALLPEEPWIRAGDPRGLGTAFGAPAR
jgi:arylsulfatase A-like enzyme